MKIEIKVYTDNGKPMREVIRDFTSKRSVKWIVLILVFAFIGTLTADTVTKPNTFTADTVISASEVNANFDTLYDLVNGNLDSNNIAGIDASDVTSGTLDAARVPDLDASKITSGTIDSDRLPTRNYSYSNMVNDVSCSEDTWVDLTDLDTSITTSGGNLSLTLNLYLTRLSDNAAFRLEIDVDGSIVMQRDNNLFNSLYPTYETMNYECVISGLSSGQHNVNVRIYFYNKSGQILGGNTYQDTNLYVEEI